MAAIDIDGGVLFFFAVGSATELSVFMAGWSSRNKYSLPRSDAGYRPNDQLRSPAYPLIGYGDH